MGNAFVYCAVVQEQIKDIIIIISALPCGHEYPLQGSKYASTRIKTDCRGHLRWGTAGTKKRRLQDNTHLTDLVS